MMMDNDSDQDSSSHRLQMQLEKPKKPKKSSSLAAAVASSHRHSSTTRRTASHITTQLIIGQDNENSKSVNDHRLSSRRKDHSGHDCIPMDEDRSSSLGTLGEIPRYTMKSSFVIGGVDKWSNTQDDNHHTFAATGMEQNATVRSTGAQHFERFGHEPVERMEGVVVDEERSPMVVLDGANVSYFYASAFGQDEPDTYGIVVVTEHFQALGVRVLVVVPAPWLNNQQRLVHLRPLKEKGQVVAAPSRDDDDAYILMIARREDDRLLKLNLNAYVLSNDFFRDAIARNPPYWKEWIGRQRISYSFAVLGNRNDFGDVCADFIPNPRHPFVVDIQHGKTLPSIN